MWKVISWISVNLASIFAITQAFLKMLKEILTAILNFLYIALPQSKFFESVEKVRNVVNLIDAQVEKIKNFFLPQKA